MDANSDEHFKTTLSELRNLSLEFKRLHSSEFVRVNIGQNWHPPVTSNLILIKISSTHIYSKHCNFRFTGGGGISGPETPAVVDARATISRHRPLPAGVYPRDWGDCCPSPPPPPPRHWGAWRALPPSGDST